MPKSLNDMSGVKARAFPLETLSDSIQQKHGHGIDTVQMRERKIRQLFCPPRLWEDYLPFSSLFGLVFLPCSPPLLEL